MVRGIVIALATFALTTLCFAARQSLATEPADGDDSARQLAEEAMEKLKSDDLPAMLEMIKQKFNWPDSDVRPMQESIKHLRNVGAIRYGKPLRSIELVRKEIVGRSFVRYVYLEKWEHDAYVWRLTFYRAAKEWRVSAVTWDEKPLELLQVSP